MKYDIMCRKALYKNSMNIGGIVKEFLWKSKENLVFSSN